MWYRPHRFYTWPPLRRLLGPADAYFMPECAPGNLKIIQHKVEFYGERKASGYLIFMLPLSGRCKIMMALLEVTFLFCGMYYCGKIATRALRGYITASPSSGVYVLWRRYQNRVFLGKRNKILYANPNGFLRGIVKKIIEDIAKSRMLNWNYAGSSKLSARFFSSKQTIWSMW